MNDGDLNTENDAALANIIASTSRTEAKEFILRAMGAFCSTPLTKKKKKEFLCGRDLYHPYNQ